MEANQPRIFIYLQLRCGDQVVIRSKIREFRALGSLLADLTRSFLKGDLERPENMDQAVFEYIDANTEMPLLALRSKTAALQVSGTIPSAYQARMLDDEFGESAISLEQFIDRSGVDLDEAKRAALSELAARRHLSLLTLIKKHLRPGGDFDFEIPAPNLES